MNTTHHDSKGRIISNKSTKQDILIAYGLLSAQCEELAKDNSKLLEEYSALMAEVQELQVEMNTTPTPSTPELDIDSTRDAEQVEEREEPVAEPVYYHAIPDLGLGKNTPESKAVTKWKAMNKIRRAKFLAWLKNVQYNGMPTMIVVSQGRLWVKHEGVYEDENVILDLARWYFKHVH